MKLGCSGLMGLGKLSPSPALLWCALGQVYIVTPSFITLFFAVTNPTLTISSHQLKHV